MNRFIYDEEALGKKLFYFNDNRIDIAGLYKTHNDMMFKILIKYIINNKENLNINSFDEFQDYLRRYSLIMIYYQLNYIPNTNPGFKCNITEVDRLLENNKLMYEDINGLFYKFRNFSNSSDNKKRFKDLFIKLYINDYDDFYFINLKSFIKLLKNTNPVFLKSIEYILKKKNNFFNNKIEEYHSIFDDSNKSFDRMITESIDDHDYKYYCIEFNDGLDNLYSNINEDDYELILPLLGEFIYNSKDEFNSSIINQKELNLAMLRRSNPFKINDISFFNKKRIDEDNYQLILKKESIKNPFEFDFYLSKDKDNMKRIIIKNTGIETA